MLTDKGFDVAASMLTGRLEEGASLDDVITFLRDEGFGQIDSMKLLTHTAGLSLAEAKQAIDASPAWQDRRESNEALRRDLWEAAQAVVDTTDHAATAEPSTGHQPT
ncbi:hypothetical protein AB0B66_06215 [Catellatospora sp. NPDC049111]|uniref:hypothetical protein n=1 Tax=Catellatospora sp. NPDC049111 TaxID=3155271 RepID=UPI00340C6640